jgi:hypothetical protein
VRGKYSAENKQYIIDILNGMTADEQEFAYDLIHSCRLLADGGLHLRERRFNGYQMLSELFLDGVHGYTLGDLIDEMTTSLLKGGVPQGS